MPQRKCSIKDLKQNQKRRAHNVGIKTELKKTIKEFVATTKTDPKKAESLLSSVYKKLDKAAKRNVMHKKTVSRRKSTMAKLLTVKSAS